MRDTTKNTTYDPKNQDSASISTLWFFTINTRGEALTYDKGETSFCKKKLYQKQSIPSNRTRAHSGWLLQSTEMCILTGRHKRDTAFQDKKDPKIFDYKSMGPETIHQQVLRPLCIILEISRRLRDISEKWKKPNVTPINKKDLEEGPGNYRLMSYSSPWES